jgi:hypothetical protein
MGVTFNPFSGNLDFTGSSGGGSPGPAERHVVTFDASASWGAPSGGFYSIAIAAGTHGKGLNPTAAAFEDIGGGSFSAVTAEIEVSSTGTVTIKVPDTPDQRFAGALIII